MSEGMQVMLWVAFVLASPIVVIFIFKIYAFILDKLL